jgi:multisubunit Na+/H+ antiporter MnhB subunit
MGETQRPRRIGRSIGALVAGALTGIILSIGTDAVLRAAGIFPALSQPMSDALFLFATTYRTVYGVAGSYIAARFAPNRPMLHALVLGAIGLAVSILGLVVTWNKVPSLGPHWYPLALVALTMPQSWLGGKLCVMQLRAQ